MAEVVTIIDKYARFLTKNPLLLRGQFGYEEDTYKLKIGDGITKYKDLVYINNNNSSSLLVNYYTKTQIDVIVQSLSSSLNTLQTQVDNLTSSTDASISSIQSDIASIQGDITTINSTLSTINSTISTLQGDIISLQGDITSINSSISSINSSITSLQSDVATILSNYLVKNSSITGATKTKITYDSKGLVTSGADATTADIADSSNKRYVTDANLTVIGNTSNTNTGDETTATIKTKLGAASTIADGYLTAANFVIFNNKLSSYTETDPIWLADKPSYLTSSIAAATYSVLAHTHTFASLTSTPAILTTLGALANASGVLTNDGSGVLSWGAGGSGANTALSNLASVAINTSLLPASGVDLGSTTKPFKDLYLFGGGLFGTNYFRITGTTTGTRIITIPDMTGTLVCRENAQTFTGVKTWNDQTIKLRNPADTFSYTIVHGAIAADRILNVPVITATDTIAVLGLSQTFSKAQTMQTTTGNYCLTVYNSDATAGGIKMGNIANKTLSLIADYAGSGDIPAGGFFGSQGTGCFTFAPSTDSGSAGAKVVFCFYHGSLFKSVMEYANASTSTTLFLFKNGGVGVSGGGGVRIAGSSAATAQLHLSASTTSASSAPLKMDSGTLMTTAEAGAHEYDGVSSYITNETTSGRGLIPIEQHFKLTAAGSTISTIANFFGATSNISLVANAYYEIDILLFFLKSTTSTVVFTLTNSAAPTSQNILYNASPVAGNGTPPGSLAGELQAQVYNDTTAAYTITTGSLTDAVNHHVRIRIFLKNGTGTSLKIQATSTSGTITPGINSRWKCRRVPASNVGTFAA